MSDSDPVRSLDWYYSLPEEAVEELDRWLEENPPPEGTSQIQHAYDNRERIFNGEEDDGE